MKIRHLVLSFLLIIPGAAVAGQNEPAIIKFFFPRDESLDRGGVPVVRIINCVDYYLSLSMMLHALEEIGSFRGTALPEASPQAKNFVLEQLKLNKVPDHSKVSVKVIAPWLLRAWFGSHLTFYYHADGTKRIYIMENPHSYSKAGTSEIDHYLDMLKSGRQADKLEAEKNLEIIKSYISHTSYDLINNTKRKVRNWYLLTPLVTTFGSLLLEKGLEKQFKFQERMSYWNKIWYSTAKGLGRFFLNYRIVNAFNKAKGKKADAAMLNNLSQLLGFKQHLQSVKTTQREKVEKNYGLPASWLYDRVPLFRRLANYYYFPGREDCVDRLTQLEQRIEKLQKEKESATAPAPATP